LTADSSNKPLKIRWVMISFAFIATVLNYLHRLSFNYLSAQGELRHLIPDDSFGYIAAAFFIAYMISNGVSGFVIDKLGVKIGYSLCMVFWTTAALLHAFAAKAYQFGVCRFLLGVGEAGNWPAGIKLTSEWFPAKERSTATGIFNSGAAIGAIAAPPLIAWLGIKYGWQATFIVIGCIGYVWVAAFWFTYYTPERSLKDARARIIPPMKLMKNRFVMMFTLSKVFMDPIWYFITFWIGRYLADVHGWGLEKIGLFAILPFIAADLGNILGGLFTQMIISRGVAVPRARKIAVLLFGVIMIASLISGPFVITTPATALVILGIAGFGYAAYLSNTMAFPADVVPMSGVASVYGLASVGSGLGGAVFQSLSGIAVFRLSEMYNYSVAYNTVFIGYGILGVIGLSIIMFFMGPLKKDEHLHDYVHADLQPA
jgi:MFS transporter, ACS family, hexuronate transporter